MNLCLNLKDLKMLPNKLWASKKFFKYDTSFQEYAITSVLNDSLEDKLSGTHTSTNLKGNISGITSDLKNMETFLGDNSLEDLQSLMRQYDVVRISVEYKKMTLEDTEKVTLACMLKSGAVGFFELYPNSKHSNLKLLEDAIWQNLTRYYPSIVI